MKTKEQPYRLSFQAGDQLHQKLEAVAKATRISKSELLRGFLRDGLDAYTPSGKERKRK